MRGICIYLYIYVYGIGMGWDGNMFVFENMRWAREDKTNR